MMKLRTLVLYLAIGPFLGSPGLIGPAQATLLQAPEEDAQVSRVSPAYSKFREGIASLLKSDLQAAESAFRGSAEMDPLLAAPLLGLADVAMKRGKHGETEKWLSEAAKAEPRSDAVSLAWGRYHRARNDHTRAEQAFRQAIETRPSATAYLELGDLLLYNKNRRGEALAAYEKALALAPDRAAVRFSFASGLAASGHIDRALQEFGQAARLAPEDPEPWRAIGRLHAEQRRFGAAAMALERALKLQPKAAHLLVDRGDVAAAQGKMDDASHYYQKAARLMPDSSSLQMKLALAYQLSKNWGQAEAAYLQVLKHDPKASDAYNNLAWLALQQGKRLDDALKWASRATRMKPDNVSYLDTLGWVYKNRGDLDLAAETLRKAARMQPPLADVHYHLGIVYATQGKNADAKDAFRRAVEIQPTSPMAEDARARLKTLGR